MFSIKDSIFQMGVEGVLGGVNSTEEIKERSKTYLDGQLTKGSQSFLVEESDP